MQKPQPFGKYYLLERINVGGMAEVFKAKAFGVEGFERLVAVKKILPAVAEDDEFIRMFIDEAKIAVQLNHANIAQIFDLGMADGAYYIALEYVPGKDLRTIYEGARKYRRPISISQACFCTLKVCEGLDYAHNKRDAQGRALHIVHRDVSPQNVLISYEGEVKIIDFGIAKAAGRASRTKAGILKGKFGYMSPEQVRGLPLDRRSDIFSLGIILYELLTMERLFLGESDFSTLEKVRNVEILPPSTYNRNIPEDLEAVVLKALSRDPDDRYPTANDFHDALQRFLFSAVMFYSRKDLSAYMKEGFEDEIERELRSSEAYRHLPPPPPQTPASDILPGNLPSGAAGASPAAAMPTHDIVGRNVRTAPAVGPAAAGGPQLAWDDEEDETTVYDREPSYVAPEPAPPPEKDIVWAQPRAATGARPRSGGSGVFLAGFTLICVIAAVIVVWVVVSMRANQGSLVLETSPASVQVRVDGKDVYSGTTPITLPRLNIGHHQLEIAAPGRRPEGRVVNIISGTPVRLRVELNPLRPPTGSFRLATAPPGASVRVDGQPRPGKTPMMLGDLQVGPHVLSIQMADQESTELKIDVRAGETAARVVELKPRKVSVSLRSTPTGARYKVTDADGDLRGTGTTPGTIPDLLAGRPYEVEIRRPGYRPWKQSLMANGETAKTVLAKLVRTPRQAVRKAAPRRTARPTPRPPKGVGAQSAPPREQPGTAQPPPASAPRATPVAQHGYLNLNSKPWAHVYVDGRDTGRETPLLKERLTAGRRRLTLINAKFGINKDIWVDIRPERTSTVIVDLQ